VRGIAAGETVVVRSNGTSVELRARIDKRLAAGAVRAAEEHVRDLAQAVEVSKTP
jgi:anaerobic selenocysteine-containing dehydrogenase